MPGEEATVRWLAREIGAHLALLQDEFRRRGMDADEARLAAKRALGGTEQAKELHREARSWLWLEQVRQDIREDVHLSVESGRLRYILSGTGLSQGTLLP